MVLLALLRIEKQQVRHRLGHGPDAAVSDGRAFKPRDRHQVRVAGAEEELRGRLGVGECSAQSAATL